MTKVLVNEDNFARAESDRMFVGFLAATGGVNKWSHSRTPTPLDQQPVIRMNRDTLYSMCVADISEGATVTLPDSAGRYMSVMIVNQDHFINDVFHGKGDYELTLDRFDTPYVLVAARTLLDPADPADVAEVNALQDQITLVAPSARPFVPPEYDTAGLDATRQKLLELGKSMSGTNRVFGRKEAVDPKRHLIGTAIGWGGLPEQEAFYINVEPRLPVGEYSLTVGDVPVDAFWSISMYNADGFFEENDRNSNSVNNVTATPNGDGSITVNFGGCADDRPNCLPLTEGWNYTVRLYQPRPEVLDGTWTFPSITVA